MKSISPNVAWGVTYWIVAIALLWAAGWPNAIQSRENFVLSLTIVVTTWTTATKVENVVRRSQIRALIKTEEADA